MTKKKRKRTQTSAFGAPGREGHDSSRFYPFIGSGTTAIAVLQTGRFYIGYEIDANYVKIAKERIRSHMRQLALFELHGI